MEIGLLIIALGSVVMGGVIFPLLAPPNAASPARIAATAPAVAVHARNGRSRLAGPIHFGIVAVVVIATTAGAIALTTGLFGQG